MKIIREAVTVLELKVMAEKMFGNLVKAVVDTEKGIIAVDGELHIDLEELLMTEENSNPQDCWGINLYPEKTGTDFIEFDSMINLKPGLGNRTRGVENKQVREKIINIVEQLCSTKA